MGPGVSVGLKAGARRCLGAGSACFRWLSRRCESSRCPARPARMGSTAVLSRAVALERRWRRAAGLLGCQVARRARASSLPSKDAMTGSTISGAALGRRALMILAFRGGGVALPAEAAESGGGGLLAGLVACDAASAAAGGATVWDTASATGSGLGVWIGGSGALGRCDAQTGAGASEGAWLCSCCGRVSGTSTLAAPRSASRSAAWWRSRCCDHTPKPNRQSPTPKTKPKRKLSICVHPKTNRLAGL
jgi:hypothetical protein